MTDPLPQQLVPFYGDTIVAVQSDDGTIYAALARLCNNLGLKAQAQARRIRRHAVLSQGLVTLTVQTAGGPQELQCLKITLLPLWLSGVSVGRVDNDLQQKIVHYQTEAADVLWQAFKAQIVIETPRDLEPVHDAGIAELQRIVEMGRAMARMAEEQIALRQQQETFAVRLDNAGRVVRGMQGQLDNTGKVVHGMQGQLGDMQLRLELLEERLHPGTFVTNEQSNEVSLTVKTLAELLTSMGPNKIHYQGIFAELYRRYSVSSYKLIRQDQYPAVLQFLEDWRQAALRGEPFPPEDLP